MLHIAKHDMQAHGSRGVVFLCACMLFFPLLSRSATPPAPGTFEYLVHGDHVSLWANGAEVGDILMEIGPAFGLRFDPEDLPDRIVTCRYFNLGIERLVDRLGISGAVVISAGDRPARIVGATPPSGDATTVATPPFAWSPDVRRLVDDLRDDDVRFNGENAIWELVQLGSNAIPALEYTLGSEDYQARQFAAEALASMHGMYVPSDAFLSVLVEGLADDEYPMDSSTPDRNEHTPFTCVFNARTGYTYLTENPEYVDQADSFLSRALFSDDAQQRFLAALIFAEAGDTYHIARVAQILIPHLEDNFISSDAGCAAYALRVLGPGVRPYLEPFTGSADQQQAGLVRLILHHLDHPDSLEPVKMLPDDFSMGTYDDPVISWPGITFWGWMPENFP